MVVLGVKGGKGRFWERFDQGVDLGGFINKMGLGRGVRWAKE